MSKIPEKDRQKLPYDTIRVPVGGLSRNRTSRKKIARRLSGISLSGQFASSAGTSLDMAEDETEIFASAVEEEQQPLLSLFIIM